MRDSIELDQATSGHDKTFKAPITGHPIPITEKVGEYQPAVEDQVVSGENLDQTTEVVEIFQRDNLLARAMSTLPIERQEDGSLAHSFRIWDEEVDLMGSSSGLTSASSTLLVPGEVVPTYKAYGFLMNAEESEIIHIAEMDSVSRGNVLHGDFQASPSDLENLNQLADRVRGEKKSQMNEVNANFKKESVKGLFAVDALSPHNKLDILLAQKHLESKGLNLPMFIYDFKKGALSPWRPSTDEINSLADGVKIQVAKSIYDRELRQAGY